jgi:heptosyltransferase-2
MKHPTFPDTGRIETLLVRAVNWIGDAVMTTPAVRAIRKNFPAAKISLLAKPWVAPVYEASPHIDEMILCGSSPGLKERVRTIREIRNRKFDAAILMQNAFEAALLSASARIPIRAGYDTDGRRWLLTHPVRCGFRTRRMHQVYYYLNLLESLGLQTHGTALEIFVSETDRLRGRTILEESGITSRDLLVGINPSAAYGGAKRWFPERFAMLADRIHETFGARTLVFGGPSDRALGDHMIRTMRSPAVNLAGHTRLGEAMALIERCRLFITNDSGLMHIAAALHRPVVAIFGSTSPRTTGPLSPLARILRIPVSCSPCDRRECPIQPAKCMDGIRVEAVFEQASRLLTRNCAPVAQVPA